MRWIAALLLMLCAACEGGAAQLVIDVKTDLAAGVDFAQVRSRLAEPEREETVDALRGEPFLEGVRAATFADLSPGDREVMVELVDADGAVVLSRRVLVTLRRSLAVTVILARDCRGVVCPGAGDSAAATECLGGRCVSETCLGDEDSCPSPECVAASDCPALAGCATPLCSDGVCLYSADDDACPSGQRCDAELGCVADPVGMDAGVADAGGLDAGAGDAGAGDAGDLDAGPAADASFLSCLTGSEPLVLYDARFAQIMGSRNIGRLPDLASRPPDFDLFPMGGSVVLSGASAAFNGNATLEGDGVQSRALFDAIQPSAALSIEVWIFTLFGPQTGSIVALEGTGRLFQNGRSLEFRSGSGAAVATDVVGDLDIIHIVGTLEPTATGHKIYVDGAMAAEIDGRGRPAEWVAADALFVIGDGTMGWSGSVRRAAVYDRVLDPGEIDCLHRASYGALP